MRERTAGGGGERGDRLGWRHSTDHAYVCGIYGPPVDGCIWAATFIDA